MVAAVHFYATLDDQHALLDHLGASTLHPWPLVDRALVPLTRPEAPARSQVMVVSETLGPPVLVDDGDAAVVESSRAGLFNRMNLAGAAPGEALVDPNASPVLLWCPATYADGVLRSGHIGSQADAMAAVSADYDKWVKRVMGWVRRRGTRVWGLQTTAVRPDLDVRRDDVTTVVALPGALEALLGGAVAE